MAAPRPNLELFNDLPCLVAKKCRSSTPSLRPPKPPTKSSNSIRRRQANNSSPSIHDGSFSYAFQQDEYFAEIEQTKLNKDYELIEKIGRGNFGEVYKVRCLVDNQHYAIKKTTIPYTSDSDRKRKLKEVQNHQSFPPHVTCVRYHDSWEEDGYLYIKTELCRISLNEIIEKSEERKLPEQIVWNYLIDLLLAVKHLHDHDLIHLDIKPDNIFISFDDVAKLGDFGLMYNCLDLNSSTLTTATDDYDDPGISSCFDSSTSSIDSIDEGDSKYLASETMQGKFSKAADIFSLGITIFEVASGLDLPQRGETYHKLRNNQIDDIYFNGLSSDLVTLIKIMMEADYIKRPHIDDLLNIQFVRARAKSRYNKM